MEHKLSLQGKTFIVTGANSGIGYAAARQMAERGATVIMGCRSLERGQAAQQKIATQTGRADVHLLQLDLASSASIRAFAGVVQARFARLDGLINNAANFDISVKEPRFTSDDIEEIFATNHLGPFLLTHLLLDQLKRSAPARILNVSSLGLVSYPFLKIQFDDLTTSRKRKYSPQYAYYHSKLAQIMFTRSLARCLEGSTVTANIIRVPSVRVDASRYPNVHPILKKMYAVKQRFAITPDQMAETYLKLAAAPEFAQANGLHFNEKCKVVGVPRFAANGQACEHLWQVSSELAGV